MLICVKTWFVILLETFDLQLVTGTGKLDDRVVHICILTIRVEVAGNGGLCGKISVIIPVSCEKSRFVNTPLVQRQKAVEIKDNKNK